MSIRITVDAMTSTTTRHTAKLADNSVGAWWTVSWLDGVTVTKEQAEAAMTLAEIVADDVTPIEPMWQKAVVPLANQLGLAAHWAVARIKTAAVPS